MWYLLFALVLSHISHSQSAYPNIHRAIQQVDLDPNGDVGEPLILTPYLRNNQINDARQASLVTIDGFASVPSYSGFFTVDKIYDSNLFFWFVPSQNDFENDPVLLWLQGGPGASSLYALFSENGPYVVSNGDQLSIRENSWTRNHSVLYIDNPAGTGFSFTNGGYAQNQTKVGQDLYEALVQFFTLFPELQDNPFFISGESYAGKYVPAVSYTIHKKNPDAALKINLQGLLIGNGLTDPENQVVGYGNYLYEIGLIDDNTKAEFEKYQDGIVQHIRQGEFMQAFLLFDVILNGDFTRPTLFENATGLSNYFNYVFNTEEDSSYESFLQKSVVRKAIHVGNASYSSKDVEENLQEDIMKSVAPWVSELLSNYRVLFFNGQLDIIVAYRLTANFLKHLNFSSAEEYKTAPRKIWKVDNEVAGFVKVAGNLTEVLVRSCGHMVPLEQSVWAYDLVYKFVRNISIA